MTGPPTSVPTIEVGGATLPKIGLGTWELTGQDGVAAIRSALELGYRLLDTAQLYGNEAEVGEAISTANVDRSEVFLTTKIRRGNLRYHDVIESTEHSVSELDVGTLDLLLIHWPHPRRSIADTISAMETLKDRGLVRHIGVSNFTSGQLAEARTAADGPIVTDQVLYHPLKDQSELQRYCVEHGVALTAYSPLARGALIQDEMLAEIGAPYDKTAPQIALRWLIQQDNVIAIPKASTADHLQDNLDVFDFELTEEEMDRIHERTPGLLRRFRNRVPSLVRNTPIP